MADERLDPLGSNTELALEIVTNNIDVLESTKKSFEIAIVQAPSEDVRQAISILTKVVDTQLFVNRNLRTLLL